MTTAPAARMHAPVFTTGSLMRHVAVMTATGSIGLVAIFAVDVISLFWVSRLGVQSYKAAIGYASQLSFVLMSINIGLTIALSATVSRALGAGDRARARRLAGSGLVIAGLVTTALSLGLWIFRDDALARLMHAQEPAASVASGLLAIIIPANIPMGLGMALSGVLRAAGDARRAMYITLSGGIVTLFTDPLLIFGVGLGVYGAAWATVMSRLVFLAVGLHGAVRVHDLVAIPTAAGVRRDFTSDHGDRPARDHGESRNAGRGGLRHARLVGFRRRDGRRRRDRRSHDPARLRRDLRSHRIDRADHRPELRGQDDGSGAPGALRLVPARGGLRAAGLGELSPRRRRGSPRLFDAHGESADFVLLFCRYGASAWVFVTCLFVANTAFNNLGFPLLAMIFNWGRATLGTIPFVTVGAHWGGVEGALLGLVLGASIFGIAGVAIAYGVVARLARRLNFA